jgi:hypothetical protein
MDFSRYPPAECLPVGYPHQNKLGDYLTIVSDETGGDVAYAATFNGEEDIYYVRVAPLASQLLNISTRALVQTGEEVLIGGFIITGKEPKALVIRGVSPSLTGFGVSGAWSIQLWSFIKATRFWQRTITGRLVLTVAARKRK